MKAETYLSISDLSSTNTKIYFCHSQLSLIMYLIKRADPVPEAPEWGLGKGKTEASLPPQNLRRGYFEPTT